MKPIDENGSPAATTAAPKPKMVPAILIKKSKISVGDNPHLPELVKARHACGVVRGTYRLCLGLDGNVRQVDVMQSIPDADAQITQTLKQWRYQPQQIPVCFIQVLEFHIDGGERCTQRQGADPDDDSLPPPSPSEPTPVQAAVPVPPPLVRTKVVPADVLLKQQISGDNPYLPEHVKREYVCRAVRGAYLVCVGKDGSVDGVDAVHGIPGADEKIVDTVWRWRFKPQPQRVCFVQVFEFNIDFNIATACEFRNRSKLNMLKGYW